LLFIGVLSLAAWLLDELGILTALACRVRTWRLRWEDAYFEWRVQRLLRQIHKLRARQSARPEGS